MNVDVTLASPEWWLTVVIAAFVVNLISAYAKTGTDRLLGASSRNWRNFRRVMGERREDRIARASEDSYSMLLLLAREMRLRSRLVCYLIGAAIFYLFALTYAFSGGGWRIYYQLASLCLALWALESAYLVRLRGEINEAHRRHRDQSRSRTA